MTRFQEIDQWEAQVSPIFQRMLATLSSAERTAGNGPSALVAASDQLGSSARDARLWMAENPCPLAAIDERGGRSLVHATGVGAPRSDNTVTIASPMPSDVNAEARS